MPWRFPSGFGRAGAVAALIGAACLSTSRPCSALGSLLATQGDTAAAVEIRVAMAASDAHTTRWFSLRVHATSRRVAWVVPLLPGTAVDPANDAWLNALEQATAPRIIAPADNTPALCGPTTFENTASAPLASTPPSQVALLSSLTALDGFVRDHAFELTSAQRLELASAVGAEYLALVYTAPAGEFWTETLRVQNDPGTGAGALAGLLGEEPALVTWFSVGRQRAHFASRSEISAPQISALWLFHAGKSDYLSRRDAHLNAGAFVLESSEARSLHEARTLAASAAGGAGLEPALPSLAQAYFEGARLAGLTPDSTRSCEEKLSAARQQGYGGSRVSAVCAPALFARRPNDEPCTEAPLSGEIAADALRCGAADDLAFALAGLNPSSARVTRHVVRLDSAGTGDLTPTFVEGAEVPSLWFARPVDGGTCVTNPGPGSGFGPYPGAPVGSAGTHSGTGGADGDYVEEGAYAADADGTCAASVGSACSSEEPGYASEEDESCSSDSSGSSEEESCSGDDESSGYDGETCSDDSSGPDDSGYDGDTCSDDSASNEEDSCAVRRPARFRPRFSVLMMALAAALLPLRRWSRRKRRICRERAAVREGSMAEPLKAVRGRRNDA
jgi:hypothetical protein